MGFKKWFEEEALPLAKKTYGYTPAGMGLDALGITQSGGPLSKDDKVDQGALMDTAMGKGMEQGKALGSELMSDPDLLKSREGLKGQLALTGPNQDLINQQASKQVQQMRYKGVKLSPIQQIEAQRKLSADKGAQSFMEDQQKAKDLYSMDLQKAKFLGQMSMSGALAATSNLQQPDNNKFLGIF